MSTETAVRTNGDRIDHLVSVAKDSVMEAFHHAMRHPDEVAVRYGPVMLLAMATARHDLSYAERAMVVTVGTLCGEVALDRYLLWKAS